MLVANFSAQRSEHKGTGRGPARGTGDTVGSLPCHFCKASKGPALLQRAACAPEPQNSPKLWYHSNSSTYSSGFQAYWPVAQQVVQHQPAPSLLPCCCMCLLVPGQGPGSALAHCRSLHHFPHPACHCRHFPIWSSWGERQAGRHVAATATRHQAARPGETTPWSWCEMCQLDIAAR